MTRALPDPSEHQRPQTPRRPRLFQDTRYTPYLSPPPLTPAPAGRNFLFRHSTEFIGPSRGPHEALEGGGRAEILIFWTFHRDHWAVKTDPRGRQWSGEGLRAADATPSTFQPFSRPFILQAPDMSLHSPHHRRSILTSHTLQNHSLIYHTDFGREVFPQAPPP